KIIDFGLAKANNRVTVTGLGVIMGKVAYMAPEQTKSGRDLDHRADLFALGITLYELTADTRLFKRKHNVETLAAVAECKVPDPTASQPDYSPALWEILKKALSKDREDRYQSGKEMAEALDAFSRSRGRVVTASTVAAFMEELFGAQRERYQKWLDEVRSERPVPSAEESFRGPTSADDNALIVGAEAAPAAGPVTDRKNDRPRLPADRTSDVRGFDREPAKRPDPFAPRPEAPKETSADVRASGRAWLWALALLVASSATVWWASHRF
ncbi:MAG TPA: protein kinase, partial [Polyangiaceae bacterium]|nr:protein kinase [Polyangiaceae bacterium]